MKITYLRIFAENALNFTACRFQKTKYLSLWKFKKHVLIQYTLVRIYFEVYGSVVSQNLLSNSKKHFLYNAKLEAVVQKCS